MVQQGIDGRGEPFAKLLVLAGQTVLSDQAEIVAQISEELGSERLVDAGRLRR